jgi:hypothetical protein
VPSLGRVNGFSGENVPVTLYDPGKRTFEAFLGFRGRSPAGYTLRTAYDGRRDRILLISWDRGPNVWAFDLGGNTVWSFKAPSLAAARPF